MSAIPLTWWTSRTRISRPFFSRMASTARLAITLVEAVDSLFLSSVRAGINCGPAMLVFFWLSCSHPGISPDHYSSFSSDKSSGSSVESDLAPGISTNGLIEA